MADYYEYSVHQTDHVDEIGVQKTEDSYDNPVVCVSLGGYRINNAISTLDYDWHALSEECAIKLFEMLGDALVGYGKWNNPFTTPPK